MGLSLKLYRNSGCIAPMTYTGLSGNGTHVTRMQLHHLNDSSTVASETFNILSEMQ